MQIDAIDNARQKMEISKKISDGDISEFKIKPKDFGLGDTEQLLDLERRYSPERCSSLVVNERDLSSIQSENSFKEDAAFRRRKTVKLPKKVISAKPMTKNTSKMVSNTESSFERLPLVVLDDVPKELQRIDIALVPKDQRSSVNVLSKNAF